MSQVDNVRSLNIVLGMEEVFNRRWMDWLAEHSDDQALRSAVRRLLQEGAEAQGRLQDALAELPVDRTVPVPPPADPLEVLEVAVDSKRALSDFYEVAARSNLPDEVSACLETLAEVERKQAAVLATFLPTGGA